MDYELWAKRALNSKYLWKIKVKFDTVLSYESGDRSYCNMKKTKSRKNLATDFCYFIPQLKVVSCSS
jgi:hypothetical protein